MKTMDFHKRYQELLKERPELFSQSDELKIITDEEVINGFEKDNNIQLGVLYESKFNMLIVDLVEDGKGVRFPYERLV